MKPIIPNHTRRNHGAQGHGKQSRRQPARQQIVTKAEAATVGAWRTLDCVYEVASTSHDDWFWMLAAVSEVNAGAGGDGGGGQEEPPSFAGLPVVTNDRMRNHWYKLVGPQAFARWRASHVVRFDLDYSPLVEAAEKRSKALAAGDPEPEPLFDFDGFLPEVILGGIPAFSSVVQERGGAWHVPAAEADADAAAREAVLLDETGRYPEPGRGVQGYVADEWLCVRAQREE